MMKGVPECIVPGQGGFLELSDEVLQRLICTEPIEKYYEVEDEPFARGKYAAVRRCRERLTGRQFAAKFLRKRSRTDGDHRNEILHEVAVLEACKPCSRIVNLHQVFESPNEMVLMLEMACGGELQMLLDSDEVPAENQVQQFMRQIMEGICYLHDINVAHLDLKPQNLVLTGTFPDCEVKLCDFGISRYLSQGADVREILGTPDYVAPEVLNYEPISLATDMWSVGVLLYVLLTGCSPFGGDTKQETFCNISQCRLDFPEDLFEDISEEAKDLMTKLMVKLPSSRLTAKQCLEHAWFVKQFESSPSLMTIPSIPTTLILTSSTAASSTPTNFSINSSNNNNNNNNSNNQNKSDTPFEPAPRLSLKLTPIAESTNNNEPRTPINNNMPRAPARPSLVNGMSEQRRQSLRHNLDSLIKRLDDTVEEKRQLSRVDSLSRRNRAAAMQTMPPIRYCRSADSINNINEASVVFRFQKVVVIDEDEGLPPSPISTDNSSISDSNSDSISEMSIDSSSDRSSIISLDDSLDYPYKYRHYSSCHNIWEAARHQQRPSPRPWPPKECNDSFVKAMSRFRGGAASPKLTVFSSSSSSVSSLPNDQRTLSPRRSIGLDIVHRNANLVVIREHKAVNNRYAKTSELKCESVRSKIRKFQVPESTELNSVF